MRDRADMLIKKLGMLGGGGIAVGGMLQQQANEQEAEHEKATMQSRQLADAVTHFQKLKIIQEMKERGEYVEPSPEDDFNDGMPEPGESSYAE